MKIAIKAVYGPYIIILGTLLNIASIIASLITKNHKELFLVFVPVSYIYWFLFMLIPVVRPDHNEIPNGEQWGIIHDILFFTLFLLTVLSLLTNFSLTFVLAMKGISV